MIEKLDEEEEEKNNTESPKSKDITTSTNELNSSEKNDQEISQKDKSDKITIEDLILEEPEIVKQGQKYGVKLRAKAPSIHMMKIDTETEISPIVGSEKQSEELVKYLLSEFESDPAKIWQSNLFGKSLHELVNEGLQNKLAHMPEDAQKKLRETLEKIVNEGSGGLICIIL